MNRLVLIGNGFDLAHGLKTSYADFINWYWEEWGKRLLTESKNVVSDELCSFTLKTTQYYYTWYQLWSGPYLQKSKPFAPWDIHEVVKHAKEDRQLGDLKYASPFFEKIDKCVETKGWVDIEREYYRQLTNVGNYHVVNRPPNYLSLNKQLEFLREKLIEYLAMESIKKTTTIEDIMDKIYCPIRSGEVSVSSKMILPKRGLIPSRIMLLNFNYTTTPELYMEGHSNVTINYIHGRLDDPQSVIFGYGDELDENYNKLKEQEDNECMRHVKSIRYLEHDNYRRMLEFIEAAPFQVVIMGHSCGNSDRTLLNTLFEHPNCVSIKPYYYIDDKQQDNFGELSINIHRNFNDPKLMRDRVVCKDYCEALTGVKPGVKVLG